MGATSKISPEVWAAIEADHAAGILTIPQIATKHGVKVSTIVGRAHREQWKRDLSHRIAERTAEKLFRESVVEDGKSPREVARAKRMIDRQADQETIEAAAEMQATLMLKHRSRVSKASAICDSLMTELAAQALTAEDIQYISELVSLAQDQEDDKQADPARVQSRMNAWKKLLALNNRADILKKLADSLGALVKLERLVYGISDNANGSAEAKAKQAAAENEANNALPINEVARRVAFTLLMGSKQKDKADQTEH